MIKNKYRFKKKYLRGLNLKEKKQKQKRIIKISIVFLFVVAFIYFAFCPYFQVQDIEINGIFRFSSQEDLKNYIDELIARKFLFISNKNIFFINKKDVEEKIKQNNYKIDSVVVKKKYPNKISISVEERFPIGTLVSKENIFLFDKKGYLFQQVESDFHQQNLIRLVDANNNFSLGDNYFNKEFIDNLNLCFDFLQNKLNLDIESINISNLNKISINTEQSWEIFILFNENLKTSLKKLEVILLDEIIFEDRVNLDYIDLRFEKVFYKFIEKE